MVYYTMVKIPWYFAGVYLDTIFTMVLQWYIAPKYHCNFFYHGCVDCDIKPCLLTRPKVLEEVFTMQPPLPSLSTSVTLILFQKCQHYNTDDFIFPS